MRHCAKFCLLASWCLTSLWGATSVHYAQADNVTIAVAANFAGAAKALKTEFEKGSSHTIELAYGSTGAHYAQIKQGAPFDAFFSADISTPEKLEQEGVGIPNTRFTYAYGRLVLWSLQPELIRNKHILENGTFKHLAIANPKLAPYGEAAQQTLTSLGLLEKLQPRLVFGENISQTYQFVYSGAADLGFIALSQIKIAKQGDAPKGSSWIVPENFHAPIEQQAILLKEKKPAREFLSFVKSAIGSAIIREFGYGVAESTTTVESVAAE